VPALFPPNRAKGQPDLSDSATHATHGCRRDVRARGGGLDGQNRTEKGHCGGAGAYGLREQLADLACPGNALRQVLLALVLLGAGDIAVVTPVADVILNAVPRERTGSAAAVNGAAMQIGGALGTAVLTSVLMAVARAAYYQRLERAVYRARRLPPRRKPCAKPFKRE
jgi:hypothetical protein